VRVREARRGAVDGERQLGCGDERLGSTEGAEK
jgi:hypothetical protein